MKWELVRGRAVEMKKRTPTDHLLTTWPNAEAPEEIESEIPTLVSRRTKTP